MPTLKSTFNEQSRSLDARPDRYDVRDRKYQPRLVNLPAVHPDGNLVATMLPRYQALVLDQKSEGACTGFGLAAMINFLRFKEVFLVGGTGGGKKRKQPPLPVSPRMLYEHARLYDEWPGEDYEGSSCRGAMKGWHRHGVCLEKTWPYLDKGGQLGRPAARWQSEAAQITLGAYYRVETDDITSIQSAIYEVGAVYVSADVHAGWDVDKDVKDLPCIPWKSGDKISGGHAFALVGFNSRGFIVQNSWAKSWGYHGFALLTYEDWLENATDAWVAALGVPRPALPVPANFSSQSFNLVAGAALAARAPEGTATATTSTMWSEDEARSHALVLGNDGVLLRSSAAYDVDSFVNEALIGRVREWMAQAKGNRRVAIYAHGGLNDEDAAIRRVRIMAPSFKANGIFPIFIVWKTGWKESLLDMGEDILMKLKPGEKPEGPSGGMLDWIGDKIVDGWDYTVETALGFLGQSLWRQMKQNSEASGAANHGGDILSRALVQLRKEVIDTEVHLVGHSAGSIWNGQFLTTLGTVSGGKFPVASCHLFAAACTVPFANDHYAPAISGGMLSARRFWTHNLSDDAERADNVGGFYRKSLLYFVSRACEEVHKTPILGMEATWNRSLGKKDIFHEDFDTDVAKWRAFVAKAGIPPPVLIKPDDAVNDGKQKQPPSHGGFDNDIRVITYTVARILRQPPTAALPQPITSLAGF